MLKKETNLMLDNYIKMCKDFDSLSAKKMANECFVSASTISRYVKAKGFDDFKHFKYHLKNQRKQIVETDKSGFINPEWINLLDYNLNILKQVDFSRMEKLRGKKILVYSDAKYDNITNIFLEKVQVIHDSFTKIRSRSEMDFQLYKNLKNCVILSIGEIPEELYDEEYTYYEIKYSLEKKEELYDNVTSYSLISEDCNPVCTGTQNLSFLYIFLEVIAEEYTKVMLSVNDYEILSGFSI